MALVSSWEFNNERIWFETGMPVMSSSLPWTSTMIDEDMCDIERWDWPWVARHWCVDRFDALSACLVRSRRDWQLTAWLTLTSGRTCVMWQKVIVWLIIDHKRGQISRVKRVASSCPETFINQALIRRPPPRGPLPLYDHACCSLPHLPFSSHHRQVRGISLR